MNHGREFTIAVVFAMEVELNAFRFMLDEAYDDKPAHPADDPNRYFFGRIGPHDIVLASLPHIQGKGAAAMVTANLSRSFPSIRWRLLVGIGGGVPGPYHDIQLGDVVVSMPTPGDTHGGIVQYELGRGSGVGFQRKGFLQQPPGYLVSTVSEMRAGHLEGRSEIGGFLEELLQKSPEIREIYQEPDRNTDVLFPNHVIHLEGQATCDNCDRSGVLTRPPRYPLQPKIHYGLIASGDEVVVDIARRNEFIDRVKGDVLCFEMEAAGVATQYPCLVIRGISDYADSHRTRGWRAYASATAAACAKELLYLIEADPISRTPTSPIKTTSYKHISLGLATKQVWSSLPPNAQRELLLESLDFEGRDERRNNVDIEQSGTCGWFIESDIWKRWYQSFNPALKADKANRLLCIRGKPGAGKSTLIKFALNHTQEDLQDQRSDHLVVSHFFNARGVVLETSPEGMYRAILFQLVKSIQPERLTALPSLRDATTVAVWTAPKLLNLMRDTLKERWPRRVTCFVDALDECDHEHVTSMLKSFRNLLVEVSWLKICFACRHYPNLPLDENRQTA